MAKLIVLEAYDAEGNLIMVDKQPNIRERLFISRNNLWNMRHNKIQKPLYRFKDITDSLKYDVYQNGELVMRGTRAEILSELNMPPKYFKGYESGERSLYTIILNDERLPKDFTPAENGLPYNVNKDGFIK